MYGIGERSVAMRAKMDRSGTEIDAEFDLAFAAGSVRITVHARGGSAASGDQTNPGYEVLVQAILERLKSGGADLEDVLLASKTVAHLPPSERRVPLRDFTLPIALSKIPDVTDVRLAIRRAVVTSHSRSKVATHGNATKRIELVALCPVPVTEMASMLEWGDAGVIELEAGADDPGAVYVEGGLVLRTHLRRERNRQLVVAAKAAFKRHHGRVFCEACGFDFAAVYGDLGADFIEAHHEAPLAEREGISETRIQDLRMVCGNCHRMLHRRMGQDGVNVDLLRQLLSQRRL